jgi:hypothetical protein
MALAAIWVVVAGIGVSILLTATGSWWASGLVLVCIFGLLAVGSLVAAAASRRTGRASPLRLTHRQDHCCFQDGAQYRAFVAVENPAETGETIRDVELHVEIVRLRDRITGRTMKWVGETASRRDIAAGGHHHAECAALEDGQHSLLFWALQGEPPDPRAVASVPIEPGDYKALVTIVSDRKPIKREVQITCAKGSLSLRCR